MKRILRKIQCTWSERHLRWHSKTRKPNILWKSVAILILLVGLYSFSLASPQQAYASVSDCHVGNNSQEFSISTFTLNQYDTQGNLIRNLGAISFVIYYCPAYQSAFARFIYASQSRVTTIPGQCAIADRSAHDATVYSCDLGLSDGQPVDTRAVYGPGHTWYAFWSSSSFYEDGIGCQGPNGPLATCISQLATAPA